jgi:hypothetical protein
MCFEERREREGEEKGDGKTMRGLHGKMFV